MSVDEPHPPALIAESYWRPIDASMYPAEKEKRLRKYWEMISDIKYVLLRILYFVHPHLHYLVDERLSTRYTPPPMQCKCKQEPCKCPPPEVFILPRPQAIPIDLYVRASLYRDPKMLKCTCTLMTCKCGTLPMPQQENPIDLYVQANGDKVFLECVKNVRWCIDQFLWYINAYPTRAANFQEWPTCENAYVDAKEYSPLLLMWARKNRCSCLYNFKAVPRLSPKEREKIIEEGNETAIRNLYLDERVRVRAVRRLSPDERVALTWLEDNQRRYCSGAFDIPIWYNPNRKWKCLWTTYLEGLEPDDGDEDEDEDTSDLIDIVDYMDITNAVDLETNDVPTEVINSVARILATSVRVPNTTLDSRGTTIWTYERVLNSIVTDKQVIISWTFKTRHQLTVAFTVLAHAIRMEILQNDDVKNCRSWSRFIEEVVECTNKKRQEAVLNHYSRHCPNNNIIPLLMYGSSAAKLDLFSRDFIRNFEIRLTANDQRADVELKIQHALTYNAVTGLYVCEFFESTSSPLAASLYLPLLIRKDNICLQNVATIYEKVSDGTLLFRLITRSRTGLCANKYVWCEYNWNSFSAEWGNKKPVDVPTNGKIFPCKLGQDHKLIACVYIPTKTQHIPQASLFAMKLSESEELVTENWAVKDSLSVDPAYGYPLTKRVLHKMARDLMTFNNYYQSNQHFLVSDTLVDELNSFEDNLSQLTVAESTSVNYRSSSTSSTSSSTSIQFSNELIQLKEFLTQESKLVGCVHLLISYKKSGEGDCRRWIYAYFLLHTKELVIMTRRCDNVRDIVNIGACLKRFISIVFPSVRSIPIAQVLWKSRDLCDYSKLTELSGYYAFKQFWKHAELIRSSITAQKAKNSSPVTYTSTIKEYEPEDRFTAIPSWGPREITNKQLNQLIFAIRYELFSRKSTQQANSYSSGKFYVPEFLLTQ